MSRLCAQGKGRPVSGAQSLFLMSGVVEGAEGATIAESLFVS